MMDVDAFCIVTAGRSVNLSNAHQQAGSRKQKKQVASQ
jgi:hypothetical protein